MCCSRRRKSAETAFARATVAVLLAALPVVAASQEAGGAYVLGGGVQLDSADGVALSALGSLELGQKTWLSSAIARTDIELPRGLEAKTWYGDLGIDHQFDPVGVRLGLAYWGDNDFFDALDIRGALYVRGDRGSLSVDVEHRDFELDLPATNFRPARDVRFDAVGTGLSARYSLAPRFDVRVSGMSYEYDLPFNPVASDRLLNILSVSRLSLLSSLIDWRIAAGLGVDFGLRRFEFDLASWQGAIDRSENVSATLGFLTPVSDRTDIELRLGFDDSDLYGEVTVLSLFVYFYGGGQ